MTPEQRDRCRSIERAGYEANQILNRLHADLGGFRRDRSEIEALIATNRLEISRLQRERATACLPSIIERRPRGGGSLR